MDEALITARADEIVREVAGDVQQLLARQNLLEDERVITVRMPRSFHAALKRSAHRSEGSMNKHAIVLLFGAPAMLADIIREVAMLELLAAPRSSPPPVAEPELLRT